MRTMLMALTAALALAVLATSASAQTPSQRPGATGGYVTQSDPIVLGYDSLAKKRYASTAKTFMCWRKNKAGTGVIYRQSVRWHWSWYLNGSAPDTMRSAWHGPIYATGSLLWKYIGSTQGSMWKSPAMWFRPITSNFKLTVGPVTIFGSLTGAHYLWTHGNYVVRCLP